MKDLLFTLGFTALGPLIGLPLALVGWILARRDLSGIRVGLVYPDGYKDARSARRCGVIVFVMTGISLVFWGIAALLLAMP